MKPILRAALVAASVLLFSVSASAQLQQSGGSSGGGSSSITSLTLGGNAVTAQATGELNTNLGRVGGSAVSLGQKAAAASFPVVIASDQSALSVALSAGTNLIGTVAPKTSCGTTFQDSGPTTLSTTPTAATNFNGDRCVLRVLLSNVTGSAASVTITDGQGTPVTYVSGFSIPANSNVILDLAGMKFTSGLKWSAGTGSAVVGQVVGYQ